MIARISRSLLMRKTGAYISAVFMALVGMTYGSAPAGGDGSVMDRINKVRTAIDRREVQRNEVEKEGSSNDIELAQWGNWRNWGNWGNWNNWNNWGNWGNF